MNNTAASIPSQTAGIASPVDNFPVGLGALRALVESLQWPAGWKVVGIRLCRAWTGRNKRLTVEHRVSTEADGILAEYPVQGVIAETAPRGKFPGSKPRVEHDMPMGILLVDRAASCWLTSPDRDPELCAARTLFEPQGPARIFRQAMSKGHISPHGNLADLSNDSIRLVSYRAGRRFVMRLQSKREDSAGVFVKGFRRPPSLNATRRASELAELLTVQSDGWIRVPSLLGVIPEAHLQVYSEIWPRPTQTHYSSIDVSSAARVASLIHALPPGDDCIHSSEDERNTIERWLQVFPIFRSDRYFLLKEILSSLRTNQPPFSMDSAAVIHRDFYHAQLLRNNDAIWLTDWDTLCQGHPEVDIATYVAHAILDAMVAGSPIQDWKCRLQQFLKEYRASGALVDLNRLGWYLACALTRMAAMFSARQYPDAAMLPVWQLASRIAECPHTCMKELDR